MKIYYHFIDVDTNNILPKYQIILIYDCLEAENCGDKIIKIFNFSYLIIMLKDCNDKIVGILKLKYSETYKWKEKYNLDYRKYRSITSYYKQNMFSAICSREFHYYQYMSNAMFCYDKSNLMPQE